MPIYEYDCRDCGKHHEVIQKFSDSPLTKCPDCGGGLEKQMSLSSFSLKGSGWYTTDYKRKTQKSSDPKPPEKTASESTDSPSGAGKEIAKQSVASESNDSGSKSDTKKEN